MTRLIEFYYDFASPNAYLVEAVLPKIAAQHGARIQRIPVLVGGIFKAAGNTPPLVRYKDIPSKVAYLNTEVQRFVKKYDVPFTWTPHFPILSTTLMRAALYAQDKTWEPTFRETIYRLAWVDGADVMDVPVVANALTAAGLPASDIIKATQDPDIKARLFEQGGYRSLAKDKVDGMSAIIILESFFEAQWG